MRRNYARLMAVIWILCFVPILRADEKPPTGGTMTVGGRTYQLTKFAAYESGRGDEALITVLASDRNLPLERIKKTLAENDGSDDRLSLAQPYLKVVYRKSGEIQACHAWADNASFSEPDGQGLAGQVKLVGNRVQGQAILQSKSLAGGERGFSVLFDAPWGFDAATPKSKPSGPVKPTVSGKFTGNGKPARLAFVSARWRESFADKSALMLIFTEKDHSKAQRPDIKAGFGDFGGALIISFSDDGGIFGCEVGHAAHSKKPFSSLGNIRMAEFDLGEGFVTGRIATDGVQDTFDQKWEVDIKFAAPVTGRVPKPTVSKSPPAAKKSADPSTPPTPKPAVAALNVRDLPLPKDATDVEYKDLVEQMAFRSPTKVQSLANDFAKKLAEQGWKGEGGDLVTAKTAILNRTRGEATLTIMVKPAGSGSTVQIFATGLEWGEKPE